MAVEPSNVWYFNFKEGSNPTQEVSVSIPQEALVEGMDLRIELDQTCRFFSRKISLGGDISVPKKIRLYANDVKGSIIVAIITETGKTLNQWVFDTSSIEFVLIPVLSTDIILAFRMSGNVSLSALTVEVEDIPVQQAVDWVLSQFENPGLCRKKGFLELYLDFLLKSNHDLRAIGFLDFLFNLEKFRDIIDIVGVSCENRRILEIRNRAKLCITIDHPDEIRKRMAELGIKGYRVALINSGLGDILTSGNLSSYLCERFGLNFAGMHLTFAGHSKRDYYDDTFFINHQPPLKDRTLFIKLDDIADNMDDLISSINQAVPGQYDEICLVPTSPNTFSTPMKHSKKVCNEFIFNQFNRYIKARHTIERYDYPEKSVLIHARLGDVAPIPVGNWCVSLYDLLKGNNFEGLVEIDSKNRSITMQSLKNLRALNDFMLYLKENDNSVRINFISDGFDLTRKILKNPDLQAEIIKCLPDITIEDLVSSTESMEESIRSLPADQAQVGERTIEDFYNSVALILSSDVVISTARSFVFNCLANFKYGDGVQHFFSPVSGGYFKVLEKKGCVIHRFSEFEKERKEILDCLHYMNRNGQDEIEIPGCCIRLGNDLDQRSHFFKSLANDVNLLLVDDYESYNSADSNGVLIDLLGMNSISKINLFFKNEGVENSRTFIIDTSEDGKEWCRIFMFDIEAEKVSVDTTGIATRFIRIERIGIENLNLSDYKIF